MSELQIALIALGVALVVAVWLYNLRQERKQRARVAQMLPATKAPDVLMAGRAEQPAPAAAPVAPPERKEPKEHKEPTLAAPAEAPGLAAVDLPLAEEVPAEMDLLLDEVHDVEAGSQPVMPVPAEWGDGLVDCLLRIEFVKPVAVAALRAEHAPWSGRIDKPIQWLGLDEHSGRWRMLLPQDPGAVMQLAAALQLVDRKGPVSEITLSAFIDGLHRLAQRFAGLVELPAPGPLQERARALDVFCAAVDLQLALHVLPLGGELAGAKLKPLLDVAGLHREGERFVATDAAGAEVFALTCQAATAFPLERIETLALTGLTFSLDVPRVADGTAAFERMLGLAQRCAEALGAQVADAHRKPLAAATLAAIRSRIGELQGKMDAQGIPAGSVRALRLFS